MDAAGSKSRPRRSMRVATIFTGVAACTVGTATQVAYAQDAGHTAARLTPRHGARTMDSRSYGSIRLAYECGVNGVDKTWLHVSTTIDIGPDVYEYTSICFGYFGLWNSPPYTGIRAECGGNNYGLLVGVTGAGRKWSAPYGPGTTYRTLNEAHLNAVFINSWAGGDKCPIAPDFGGGYDG